MVLAPLGNPATAQYSLRPLLLQKVRKDVDLDLLGDRIADKTDVDLLREDGGPRLQRRPLCQSSCRLDRI